ncbi:electron transfer flavoprotein subunit alpha/FixB family protein [Halodesulfurarchaeum sp.]|uniref:electron transfer flavoprotein subunit alpha/FixB family protein n=1 Tax=Halodesulfurarchaeum sp. TaxID=1980530 RepID=UPI002FC2E41A
MSDVLAVVEHRRGELRPVSFELLTAGRDLAAAMDEELHVAVIGGPVDRYVDRLNRAGVDVIHTVDNGAEFNHDVYVQTVDALCQTLEPGVLLTPHTVNALDYVPAVAIDREMALVTDVLELSVEDDTLLATREFYESKVTASMAVEDTPRAVTIRPGEWPAAEGIAETEVRFFEFEPDDESIKSHVEGYEEAGSSEVDVTAADFLIGVGRGIGEVENLALIEDLAEAGDATIAASRPLVDKGWFETGRQVGQSGKTVSPDVYLAIGISGAVQHVAGIKGADTIVAINTDPHAPIFDIADQAIVGDLFEIVPALTEQVHTQ